MVRCIDENGKMIGELSLAEALKQAKMRGLDLVEIVPNQKPPICKIMDYGKFMYEEKKRVRQMKRHQQSQEVKEIKFHPTVAEHDYQTKLRHIREFLAEKKHVFVTLVFRGREAMHTELGYDLINRVIKDCSDISKIDKPPRLEGKQLMVHLIPVGSKGGNVSQVSGEGSNSPPTELIQSK